MFPGIQSDTAMCSQGQEEPVLVIDPGIGRIALTPGPHDRKMTAAVGIDQMTFDIEPSLFENFPHGSPAR